MAKKLSYPQILLKLKRAGLHKSSQLNPSPKLNSQEACLPLSERVKKIMDLFNKSKMVSAHQTLGFIMYDIEDNKIRNHIAKYLERLGYLRIQKSIFFGNIHRKVHNDVYQALKEINELYDNHDSIVFLPVSSDDIGKVKLIGKNIEFEVMMETKKLLFI